MKKILKKLICWGLVTMFLLHMLIKCIDQAWVGGQWPLYWVLKSYYYITNPNDIATAEITVDLGKDSEFVARNAKPAMWFYESGWEREEELENKWRLALSSMNGRSFEYFKVNIIYKNKKLTVGKVGRVRMHFEEYLSDREKSKVRGVVSVKLNCIAQKTYVGNDWKIRDIRSYEEALAEHRWLASKIEKFGFIKNDAKYDVMLKNKAYENDDDYSHVIYQTWKKDKYQFYLVMKFDKENKAYYNSIFLDLI